MDQRLLVSHPKDTDIYTISNAESQVYTQHPLPRVAYARTQAHTIEYACAYTNTRTHAYTAAHTSTHVNSVNLLVPRAFKKDQNIFHIFPTIPVDGSTLKAETTTNEPLHSL